MSDQTLNTTPEPLHRHRSIAELLAPAWAERKRIIAFTAGIAVVTLLVNFLILPQYYRSSATLLPMTEKARVDALGDFSGLARLAGINIPGAEVSRLYPIILSSPAILRPVIERTYHTSRHPQPVSLIGYFGLDDEDPEENMEDALKEMRDLMTTTFDAKTGTVTITLEMREPQLAADVLNAVVAELDRFMKVKRTTTASEQARWIATRLLEVEQELRAAEDSLKIFRTRNRRVIDSPELLLQQERHIREVEVKSTIYVELKKQFELAKIEEIKNTTIVNVVDPARAPVRKERPKRLTNSLIAGLLALAGGVTYFSGRAIYGERIREFLRKLGVGKQRSGAPGGI